MNAKTKAAILTIAASIFPSLSQAASYDNENAWREAVLGTYAMETFDTLPIASEVNSLSNLGIKFAPLDDGSQPTVQPYTNTGGIPHSGSNNLLNDSDYSLPARGPFTILPTSSNSLIFGLGLWNVGGDDTLKLSFYNEQNQLLESVISPSASGFFGIVNKQGAYKAVIDFVSGNGYAPIDDLQTAVRSSFIPSVPEPGTSAMFMAGLAVLTARYARRGNRKAT